MDGGKVREVMPTRRFDPFKAQSRHSLALVAFFAWVGLGADGLSSSAYGPEQAYRALGAHPQLAVYLALAMAATVFVIALAYNQVIELFPSGGGGYRIASALIGPFAGLVSGSALIVDYVLTIAISVASGVDALFSLLPAQAMPYKLAASLSGVLALAYLNLRGARESMRVLLPIFVGFVGLHAFLLLFGLARQWPSWSALGAAASAEAGTVAGDASWLFLMALILKAYSLGGGTFTGVEAISNNVNALREPRVKTGKLAMLYMALSLSMMAGGTLLLYVLYDVHAVQGQTLNAVVFSSIWQAAGLTGWGHAAMLAATLAFEAGLLMVAANSGFLGGPAVLANMATDSWVPHKFRYLSTRLVTQNGVLLMTVAAAALLLLTGGRVDTLVVLYSINVFLTFSLSLLGLCRYWLRERAMNHLWFGRFVLSSAGLIVCVGILSVTTIAKFFDGGWLTLVITASVILVGLLIRRHYRHTKRRIRAVDEVFAAQAFGEVAGPVAPQVLEQTAVFIVGSSRGGGLHALLWVQRMFPEHFRNFIFVNVRTVDASAYGGEGAMETMRAEANATLKFFVDFCHSHGMAADSYLGFGTDVVDEVTRLCQKVHTRFPNSVFFTSKLVFENDHWLTRILHNQAALALQRRLHYEGLQMVVLPMKV